MAELNREMQALRALRDYACHIHWRCMHQDRWPWGDDCMCGLVKTLRELGFEPEVAENAPII